jgi:hypothetical protein
MRDWLSALYVNGLGCGRCVGPFQMPLFPVATPFATARLLCLSFQSMSQSKPPVVLVGETGCGKSAILANWVSQRRARRQAPGSLPEFVFLHLAGSSRESSHISTLLLRAVTEIKAFFGLQVGCSAAQRHSR